MLAVDFTRLMQGLSAGPQLVGRPADGERRSSLLPHIAILIREAGGETAAAWGNVDAWRRRNRVN